MAESDPFEDLFGLEERYFDEGFKQGVADGSTQAQISARLFGIEKGYEKFIAMGKLQAKANVWAARMTHKPSTQTARDGPAESDQSGLPPLPASERVVKHLETLLALVDPQTISFANTDDAVSEFDDRLKRAQAKVKVIERIIGSDPLFPDRKEPLKSSGGQRVNASVNMEDFGL